MCVAAADTGTDEQPAHQSVSFPVTASITTVKAEIIGTGWPGGRLSELPGTGWASCSVTTQTTREGAVTLLEANPGYAVAAWPYVICRAPTLSPLCQPTSAIAWASVSKAAPFASGCRNGNRRHAVRLQMFLTLSHASSFFVTGLGRLGLAAALCVAARLRRIPASASVTHSPASAVRRLVGLEASNPLRLRGTELRIPLTNSSIPSVATSPHHQHTDYLPWPII